MTDRQTAVACRDLTVMYGDTVAVDHISFDANAGEVLGLLGPNGAGKTSAIRALTTILPPRTGEARVAGADLLADPVSVRARVGSLPESSGYPSMQTALGYLRYHGRLYGLSPMAAVERAEELLTEMGLADHARVRIRTFSRGMRQRLGIARSLVNDPEVLFLDEPTLGLDPAGKGHILQRIRAIADRNGTTVILSSHLLDEVERVCDRVVIMDEGAVVAKGSVDEVVARSGVATSVRARVPLTDVPRAAELLRDAAGVAEVHEDGGRPGELIAEIIGSRGASLVAQTLISAHIPLISVQGEGATLQDAFLALTTPIGGGR